MMGFFRFHIEYYTEEGALIPEDGFVMGESYSNAAARVAEARSDEDIEVMTLHGLDPDLLLTTTPQIADVICNYDFFEDVYWPRIQEARKAKENTNA